MKIQLMERQDVMVHDKPQGFIPVDQWEPEPEDRIFKTVKGALILPVSEYFGIPNNDILNTFVLSTKRCYNGDKMLHHTPHYMNYFEKFYDTDHELLMVIYKIKYLIDYQEGYSKEMFFNDLNKYIMSNSIIAKSERMNEDNYTLNLDSKKYRNDKNPTLQYTDKHAKILMWLSLMMNMMIPLLTHFIYVNRVPNTNQFLKEEYDHILKYIDDVHHVSIITKLQATASSNILKDSKDNKKLWDMQDIRLVNTTTHSIESVDNILLNIIPKYRYDLNIVSLNYSSIRNSNKYQVTAIGYEYNYVALSASKRDLENNSELDKFESYTTKQNEALFIQNKCQSEKTMEYIEYMFGPFDPQEIIFYKERLKDDNGEIINNFQKDLVFNLFFKYFGEPEAGYSIRKDDYVKLIISAKRLLTQHNMVILPYIISSKVERTNTRKSINKREMLKLEASPYYEQIRKKYKSEKIEKHILMIIATILASDFRIIDYHNKDIDGSKLNKLDIVDIINEEVMMYVTLI